MSGRLPLAVPALLALVFLAPLAMAWAVYHKPAWQPQSHLQYGELLRPAQPLGLEGSGIDAALFQGQWTLLYSNAGRCTGHCLAMMATLRGVRLAQGREMRRVQRVLVEPPVTAASDADLFRHDPGLQLVAAERWALPAGSLFLVDPQGYLVLRYRRGFEPMGLVKDLQRLLRLSRSR